MAITTLPTRTDPSLGAQDHSTGDPNSARVALTVERLADLGVTLATELGLTDGSTGGSINAQIDTLQGQVTTLQAQAATTAPGRVSNIPIGDVAYGSLGTEKALTDGGKWYAEIYLPAAKTLTGIAVLNGATVGTNHYVVALCSADGTRVAISDTQGTTTAGADAFQEIAFAAPYDAVPGRYWIVVQGDGTTDKFRAIAASTYLNFTGSTTGTFGTIASITPPTATAADVGPIAYVY